MKQWEEQTGYDLVVQNDENVLWYRCRLILSGSQFYDRRASAGKSKRKQSDYNIGECNARYRRNAAAKRLYRKTSSLVYGHDRELMRLLEPEYEY